MQSGRVDNTTLHRDAPTPHREHTTSERRLPATDQRPPKPIRRTSVTQLSHHGPSDGEAPWFYPLIVDSQPQPLAGPSHQHRPGGSSESSSPEADEDRLPTIIEELTLDVKLDPETQAPVDHGMEPPEVPSEYRRSSDGRGYSLGPRADSVDGNGSDDDGDNGGDGDNGDEGDDGDDERVVDFDEVGIRPFLLNSH